jgi:hypothetical protein
VPTARPQALGKKCKNVLQSDRLNHFIMAVNHGLVRNLLLRNFTHALLRMCLAQRAGYGVDRINTEIMEPAKIARSQYVKYPPYTAGF